MKRRFDIIVIGGSAGSYNVVRNILSALPSNFPLPIMLCLHRLRDAKSGLCESLNSTSNLEIIEPDDKTVIQANKVYLAPSNYHMLFENAKTIVLTVDEEVNFSRPAIDLTFESAGSNFRANMIGILLSGANSDGANGLQHCSNTGAYTIVQDPIDALFAKMPQYAISKFNPDLIATEKDIIKLINASINIPYSSKTQSKLGLSELGSNF